MKRSKKSSLLDLREITAGLEEIESKEITYEGHKYKYRIDKYIIHKNYYAIYVTGGPYNHSAITTCKKSSIQKKLKTIILILKQK